MDFPEKKLLEGILRQAIKDYIKLNPDSSLCSAEFNENEGQDYLTAEEFIFGKTKILFGEWELSYEDTCIILDIDGRKIRKKLHKIAK